MIVPLLLMLGGLFVLKRQSDLAESIARNASENAQQQSEIAGLYEEPPMAGGYEGGYEGDYGGSYEAGRGYVDVLQGVIEHGESIGVKPQPLPNESSAPRIGQGSLPTWGSRPGDDDDDDASDYSSANQAGQWATWGRRPDDEPAGGGKTGLPGLPPPPVMPPLFDGGAQRNDDVNQYLGGVVNIVGGAGDSSDDRPQNTSAEQVRKDIVRHDVVDPVNKGTIMFAGQPIFNV